MKKNAMVDLGDDMDEGAVLGEGLKVGRRCGGGVAVRTLMCVRPGAPEAHCEAALEDAQVGVQGVWCTRVRVVARGTVA